MDITQLYNVGSGAIQSAAEINSAKLNNPIEGADQTTVFGSIFDKAVEGLNTTNAFISDAENEKIRWALGETETTHDLTNALQKSSAALSYTTAVRDKFIEAYKEIMQMQI